MKALLLRFSIVFLMASFLSSCMVTKTSVGQYQEQSGSTYTYASGKQLWIFWGLIPLGRTSVNTPADGNCQVTTRYTFTDFLITILTGGFLQSYTIRIEAKR